MFTFVLSHRREVREHFFENIFYVSGSGNFLSTTMLRWQLFHPRLVDLRFSSTKYTSGSSFEVLSHYQPEREHMKILTKGTSIRFHPGTYDLVLELAREKRQHPSQFIRAAVETVLKQHQTERQTNDR